MHADDEQRIWNRWWRIEHLHKIQTKKAGEEVRFKLNSDLRVIAKYVRYWHLFLILKARQDSMSIFFLLLHARADVDGGLFSGEAPTAEV
jgi:hypothetical protein